jgi:hypothetical protein
LGTAHEHILASGSHSGLALDSSHSASGSPLAHEQLDMPLPFEQRSTPAVTEPAAGKIANVTTKERLHQLVDELSETEANEALRYIAQRREDPTPSA